MFACTKCRGRDRCALFCVRVLLSAGVVGVHSDFPIERLALSTCKRWLASASHDQSIKIWDVAYMQEVDEEGAGAEGAASGDGRWSFSVSRCSELRRLVSVLS